MTEYDYWKIFPRMPKKVTIGDITVAEKSGWSYIWIRYADATDQNVLVKQPIAVYVEKVYHDGDFSGLGIGV